jgi:predicted ATP-grasp superfamily ATP-dependent carboligase
VLLDKRRLYGAAAGVGLHVPRCIEVTSDADARAANDGGAWIAKPACRYWFDDSGSTIRTFLHITGGSKAIEGDVWSGVRRVREAGFPAIVQERVPGPFEDLFSVGLVLDRDQELLGSFCSRKRGEYPEPFGDGLIVETTECRGELVEGAAALLRSLGYWGICDVEFKRDARDGNYKLLDANPRVWLWLGLGARSGVPLALLAYALATGDFSFADDASDRARSATGAAWVSPRGAAGFLLRAWRPSKHGWGWRCAWAPARSARSHATSWRFAIRSTCARRRGRARCAPSRAGAPKRFHAAPDLRHASSFRGAEPASAYFAPMM